MPGDDNKKKLLGVYLPLFLIRQLKVYAAQKGTNTSVVVEEAVKKLLKEKTGK